MRTLNVLDLLFGSMFLFLEREFEVQLDVYFTQVKYAKLKLKYSFDVQLPLK